MSPIDEIKFKYIKCYTTITAFLPAKPSNNKPIKMSFSYVAHPPFSPFTASQLFLLFGMNDLFLQVERFFLLNHWILPLCDIHSIYLSWMHLRFNCFWYSALMVLAWHDACICVDDRITMVTIGTPIYGNINCIDTKDTFNCLSLKWKYLCRKHRRQLYLPKRKEENSGTFEAKDLFAQ